MFNDSPGTDSSGSIVGAFKRAEESFDLESAVLTAFATELSNKSNEQEISVLEQEIKETHKNLEDLRQYSSALEKELQVKDDTIKKHQQSDHEMRSYMKQKGNNNLQI